VLTTYRGEEQALKVKNEASFGGRKKNIGDWGVGQGEFIQNIHSAEEVRHWGGWAGFRTKVTSKEGEGQVGSGDSRR